MAGLKFVVHEHFSRTHHFDLRLEHEGFLESWAVPKGMPSGAEKRLAVYTEPHAMEYGEFEGEIPEGEYGAGKVEIWDSGALEVGEWTGKKISFELKGRKIKGGFVLVKTGFSEKSWLVFKSRR
ncbi:MAG: DNA polymerase ligase N-terminal domain-containing protein [Candidatus Micrarchaeota archaeon]